MRKQRLIEGLNNSQKIRVIVGGVGLYTTVGGTEEICTRKHRMAVQTALMNLSHKRRTARNIILSRSYTGFAFNYNYTEDGGRTNELVDVQVDLM